MLIEEFIAESNKVATSEQLAFLWHRAMAQLGLDRLLFTLLMEHRTINRKAGHIAWYNYPKAWLAQYSASHYEEIDPVLHHMFKARGAFTWQRLINSGELMRVQIAMLSMAERAGLNNGIGIPLRGPSGELAGVIAASSTLRSQWEAETLHYADLLTQHFYTMLLLLEQKTNVHESVRLTDKERQVLILCAQGSSRQEIAKALSVTTDTVKFHLRGIFAKLDASSQEVAVLKAIAMGLISPRHVQVERKKS